MEELGLLTGFQNGSMMITRVAAVRLSPNDPHFRLHSRIRVFLSLRSLYRLSSRASFFIPPSYRTNLKPSLRRYGSTRSNIDVNWEKTMNLCSGASSCRILTISRILDEFIRWALPLPLPAL